MVDRVDRRVVVIGRTGSGKSSAANAIAGKTNAFEESNESVSKTKNTQSEVFNLWWAAGERECRVNVIDTIGIGDTDLSHGEVLERLAEVCHDCRDGINAVYFVTGGRFTEEEASAFDLLWQVLFGPEVLNYITIVRSHFTKYKDAESVEKDTEELKKQGGPAGRIMRLIRNHSLYIDVPPTEYDENLAVRNDSGALLLNHLMMKCKETFRPQVLKKVKECISEHIEEKRKSNDELKEKEALRQAIYQMQKLLDELIKERREERQERQEQQSRGRGGRKCSLM